MLPSPKLIVRPGLVKAASPNADHKMSLAENGEDPHMALLLQQPDLFRMRIPPCATCLSNVFVSYLQPSPAHNRVDNLHALSILTRYPA